jgi:hypothetical protein
MKKYLLRYIVFWLPALAVSLWAHWNRGASLEAASLFFGFFMLFGFAVNSGMAARFHPRHTIAAILFYFGGSIILTTLVYTGQLRQLLGTQARTIAGIFSYVPLNAFLMRILDYNIPHEVYIISGLTALMLFGWLVGVICRSRDAAAG